MTNSACLKIQWNKFASSDGSWPRQGARKGSKNSLMLNKICSWIGGPRSWPPKNTDSTALTKGIHGTTGYLNLSRRSKGTQPDVRTPPRSKKARKIHEESTSSPGATVINGKSGKLVSISPNPSPVNGQRTAQAYSARATYLINHVKFTGLQEGRQSIPIENAGSSKQNSRSCTGNNKGRSRTTKDQSNMVRKIPSQCQNMADCL